jgi:proline iminopeptidase
MTPCREYSTLDRADLYPDIEPFATHRIDVGDGHNLYVEECGIPGGIPAVFLHGGPGAGVEQWHRRFFDPQRYHLVLFDQRGAGRSTPHAELKANDTWKLVSDMERLRQFFGFGRWLVFGGSWGSTLALAYAQSHPERVSAMVVRGVFLCRPHEVHWFYQQGTSRLFPDYWQDYLAPVPVGRRGETVRAYYDLLTGDDEAKRREAALAWSRWEARTATLIPNDHVVEHFEDVGTALSMARIECHFFMHDAFLEPNQLLRNVQRMGQLPGVIVHGRYDAICPLENAWELHRSWPNSELVVVDDAGHSALEPGICRALVQATDRFADEMS